MDRELERETMIKEIGYWCQNEGTFQVLEIVANWTRGAAINNPELAGQIDELIDRNLSNPVTAFAASVQV